MKGVRSNSRLTIGGLWTLPTYTSTVILDCKIETSSIFRLE